MAKAAFIKFEVTKDIAEQTLEAIALAASSGKLRRGVNEVTKAVERGVAKLVIIAEDVTPPEILMHIPLLCEEKNVPYTYVPTKADLGKASGIEVPTSSIAITEPGESRNAIADIAKKVKALK
ncbi:MAG: 50S ribosomal protein L7ae [Candidatus Aenigmarchaeota archaeon]|nr:50S ribosomal protein L7ae [Candidatus Aenigmarchaeota archaeon]